MNYIKKRITIYIFIFIIALPGVLAVISKLSGIKFEVELSGYTEKSQPVEISAESIFDGSYRDYINESVRSSLPLYGVMVKLYNTLQYHVFRTGNHAVVGESDYLFYKELLDETYLNESDYSEKYLNDGMQKLLDSMSSLQEKLNAVDKQLLIFVTPNKDRYYSSYLPPKYKYMYQNTVNNSMEVFKSKLTEAEIPCFFSWDIDDQLTHPTYYPGSFHWSRTYEQLCTKNIIEKLNNISNKNYRNITIAGVNESENPFWRDDDFINNLNIFGNQSNRLFYEYIVTPQEGDNYDVLNVMIQGDSYAAGLEKDILDNITEDNVIYINRNEYVRCNSLTNSVPIYQNFDNIDFKKYLDLTDIVIIEMLESNVNQNYIAEFIKHLNMCLDTYIPLDETGRKTKYYPSQLNFASINKEDLFFAKGLYQLETGFCWTKKQCSVAINDMVVSIAGLQLDLYVPEEITKEDEIITITVNGVEVYKDINSQGDISIKISPDDLPEPSENIYTIDITSSGDFCPKEMGISDDDRFLALRLKYVGGIK